MLTNNHTILYKTTINNFFHYFVLGLLFINANDFLVLHTVEILLFNYYQKIIIIKLYFTSSYLTCDLVVLKGISKFMFIYKLE